MPSGSESNGSAAGKGKPALGANRQTSSGDLVPAEDVERYALGKSRRQAFRDVKVLSAPFRNRENGAEPRDRGGFGPQGARLGILSTPRLTRPSIQSMPKPPLPSPGATSESIVTMLAARSQLERDLRRRFEAMQPHSGHPHLPTYLETFETADKFYIVVECVHGGDLLGYLERRGGKLPEAEARGIVGILLSTLEYLHANGIVHRDLKPANILLADADDPESLVIVDFAGSFVGHEAGDDAVEGDSIFVPAGSGMDSARVRQLMKTVVGTPFYLAPEIVDGKEYDPRVDVWSLGCIAYQLLYGRTPFQDATDFHDLFLRIHRGEFTFPPVTPPPSDLATDFIRFLLDPDPSARPTAERAARHPWLADPEPPGRARLMSGVEVYLSPSGTLSLSGGDAGVPRRGPGR
ncbi:kinase-like domain-containing protein [Hyaloraphidium curvatum]|nr:kinase-like domain-containing protein [Hyaloraphidium curvatum]